MPFIEQPPTIWTAAKNGLLAEVQRFVSEGISVDAKSRGDVTPLHEAAYSGHTYREKRLGSVKGIDSAEKPPVFGTRSNGRKIARKKFALK